MAVRQLDHYIPGIDPPLPRYERAETRAGDERIARREGLEGRRLEQRQPTPPPRCTRSSRRWLASRCSPPRRGSASLGHARADIERGKPDAARAVQGLGASPGPDAVGEDDLVASGRVHHEGGGRLAPLGAERPLGEEILTGEDERRDRDRNRDDDQAWRGVDRP